MAFTCLVRNLTSDQTLSNLQIRIAIDPKEFLLTHPNYSKITAVVTQFSGYPINVFVQSIQDENELENYNISVNNLRGSEIVIVVADSEDVLSAKNYKNMLLLLWWEFQKMEIKLLHFIRPDDHIILGPNGFPSPFSVNNIEHKKHPLLAVRFSANDLELAGIQFNVNTYREFHENYIESHLNEMLSKIEFDVNDVNKEELLYRSKLHDDAYIQKYIIQKVIVFKKISLELKEKYSLLEEAYMTLLARYQTYFEKNCLEDKSLQIFLHYYPRNPDRSMDSNVARLINLQQLLEDEVYSIIKEMRNSYEDKLISFKQDFNKFFNLIFPIEEKTNAELIKHCKLIKDNLSLLIEKNPHKMQLIFFQLQYIFKEQNNLLQFKRMVQTSLLNEKYQPIQDYYQKNSCFSLLFKRVMPTTSSERPDKEFVFRC